MFDGGGSKASRQIRRSSSCPGNHAKSLTHHFGSGRHRRGFTRGRLGHARLPDCSLRLRRLHVALAPHSPGLAREPLLAHGCSGVCGDCSRPSSLPHLPMCVPFSKSDAPRASFLPAARSRASEVAWASRSRCREASLSPSENSSTEGQDETHEGAGRMPVPQRTRRPRYLPVIGFLA